ncbi:MAG: hypothetical protein Ct9H300mP12_05540 [Acidimicrobiales bacterium]|nr:MAG: hypothetical protein Ct9H300mP12_05540 [Acidimicrobiales bacterium]
MPDRPEAHYRDVVAMDRDERIACGSYVYLTFLRPLPNWPGWPTTSTGPAEGHPP